MIKANPEAVEIDVVRHQLMLFKHQLGLLIIKYNYY